MTTSLESSPRIAHRYRILTKIGQGGMGVVYRAQDRLSGTTIALKQVLVDGNPLTTISNTANDDLRVALAQEFRLLASLRHPNIVKVLNYGFDEARQPFLAMEYLDESDTFLQAGRKLERSQQVGLVFQLLQALRYVHRHGVIHRDIKPHNVLVKDKNIKVVDFGLATIPGQRPSESDVVGTLAYAAPEIIRGEPFTQATDLYAVGMMAYELFAGRYPYDIENINGLIHHILFTMPDMDALKLDSDKLKIMIQRLLAKNPQERFSDAAETRGLTAKATNYRQLVFDTPEIRESFLKNARFVGRENEIEQLSNSLEVARSGHGTIWLVGGESGIGKSRLIEEIRIRALTEGMIVLRGEEVATGGLPFQAWREPIRTLLLAKDIRDADAAVIKDIIPDIESLLERSIPTAPKLKGQTWSTRLVGTLAKLLRKPPQPVLLILEDLHWAKETLEVLAALARGIQHQPLVVLGAYRSDEATDLPDKIRGAHTIKLERLSPEAIKQFSVAIFGQGGANQEVQTLLQRESEGNAFFLVEVASLLAEDLGQLEDIGRVTLPESIVAGGVQQVIQKRLARIPKEYQGLLQMAAVAGRQLDLRLLKHLLSSTKSLPPFERILSDCGQLAILDAVEDTWRFAHDKIREGLINTIAAQKLPRLHRQVAQALENLYPDDNDYAESLARHWRMAGDTAKEFAYTIILARREDDLDKHSRLLELCDWMLANSKDDHPDSAEIYYLRSRALLGLSRFSEGIDDCEIGLRIARAANLRLQEARLMMNSGQFLEHQGDYGKALDVFQQAHTIFKALENDRGIANSLYSMSVIYERQGHYPSALKCAEESLAIRRTSDLFEGIIDSLTLVGTICLYMGEQKRAREALEESLVHRREMENPFGLAISLNNLGMLLDDVNEPQTSRAYYEEALAICRGLGNQFAVAAVLGNLSAPVWKLESDKQIAIGLQEESLAICRQIGDKRGIASALVSISEFVYELGEFERAMSCATEAVSICREIGEQSRGAAGLCALADACLGLNKLSESKSLLHECLTTTQVIGDVRHLPARLVSVSRYFSQIGDHQRATTLLSCVQSAPHTPQILLDTTIPSLLVEQEGMLPPEIFRAARERGKTLSIDEATTEAITALA